MAKNLADMTQLSLLIFIEQKEKEEIEKELEAGYKSNYGYNSTSGFSFPADLPRTDKIIFLVPRLLIVAS